MSGTGVRRVRRPRLVPPGALRSAGSSRSLRLLAAQAAGQLCLVVVVPVLTRLYDPATMGGFQLATAIAVVIQPIGTLGHEFTVPVAGSMAEVTRQLRRAWSLLSGLTLLLLLTGAVLVRSVVPDAAVVIMVGMLLLAYGGGILDNAFLLRMGATDRLAVRNLVTGVAAGTLQVVGGLVWTSAITLALAVLLGRVVSIAVTSWGLDRRAPDDGGLERSSLRRAFSASLAQLLSVGSMQSLTVLVSFLYGLSAAGLVGLAVRTAAAPIGLFGQALAQVSQSSVAPAVRSGTSVMAAMARQLKVLVVVAVGLAVLMVVVPPLAAGFVLGPQWAGVGWVVAILAVPFALQVVMTPVFPVYAMVGRERRLLVIQALRFGAGVVGIALSSVVGLGYIVGVATFSIVESVLEVVTIWWGIASAREYDRENAARRPDGGPG